ncbi:phosphatase PAP2 family protein, partial [Paenibacillus riograndensis]|uniref:phosphatase PAP2 family protein n=1 Tax=Paenibacillus riograndensis TaxID=483937 RepID=UPI0009E6F0DC
MHVSVLDLGFFFLAQRGVAPSAVGSNLLRWALAPQRVRKVGLQAISALAISHLTVAIGKKLYTRVRPYVALPGTNTFHNPPEDHPFSSGHTTAIFAATVPYMVAFAVLTAILLPLACIVGFSRIFLLLHCPSAFGSWSCVVSGRACATI